MFNKYAWFVAYSHYNPQSGMVGYGNTVIWTNFFTVSSKDNVEEMERIVEVSLLRDERWKVKVILSNFQRLPGADREEPTPAPAPDQETKKRFTVVPNP